MIFCFFRVNWKNTHKNTQNWPLHFFTLHNTNDYLVEIDIHLNGENGETLSISFQMLLLKYWGTNDGESRSLNAMVFLFSESLIIKTIYLAYFWIGERW